MISELIRRARRRVVRNELLSALTLAASVALGAIVLLLLFGTQILDWRILAVLCLAGLGLALVRTMRRVPSPYRLAIAVDRRAGLQDSLSTALFFEDAALGTEGAPVRAAQKTQAEALIERIDLAQAVPFTLPKAIYAVGALGLIASSLVALRYGIDRRLDLKPPLTTILMDTFGFASEPVKDPVAAQKRKRAGNARNPDLSSNLGMTIPQPRQKQPEGLDAAPDSALDTVGVPEVNNEKGASGKKDGQAKTEGGKSDGEKGDAESSDDASPATAGKNASDNPSGSRDGPQQGEQAGGKQANSGENSSLMAKLKDAMSNLLSKA